MEKHVQYFKLNGPIRIETYGELENLQSRSDTISSIGTKISECCQNWRVWRIIPMWFREWFLTVNKAAQPVFQTWSTVEISSNKRFFKCLMVTRKVENDICQQVLWSSELTEWVLENPIKVHFTTKTVTFCILNTATKRKFDLFQIENSFLSYKKTFSCSLSNIQADNLLQVNDILR